MTTRIPAFALLASAALFFAAAAPANAALDDAGAQALLKKSGCATCHKLDKKGVGPSIMEIAKKRKGDANAAAELKKSVRSGSTGVYGSDAMPAIATSKLSDEKLNELVKWILSK